MGNVGRDPEVRNTPGGQSVASFTLATSRRWKDREGQKQEETEWHNVVVWGKQAEIAAQYITKGKQVYVQGRIKTRSWDDAKSGEKKYRTEIICENFQLVGGRSDGAAREESARPAVKNPERYAPAGETLISDDDIPF